MIQKEIDKAGAGNFNVGEDVAESGVLLHGFDQSRGEFTGVLTGFLGALQCDGTGKITVAGLLGAFKADGFLGKTASGQGTGQKFSESLFLVFDHFSSSLK